MILFCSTIMERKYTPSTLNKFTNETMNKFTNDNIYEDGFSINTRLRYSLHFIFYVYVLEFVLHNTILYFFISIIKVFRLIFKLQKLNVYTLVILTIYALKNICLPKSSNIKIWYQFFYCKIANVINNTNPKILRVIL